MRYITPRKAASGLGSGRSGTQQHWQITVSSAALLILTPLFLIAVGGAIGLPREGVIAHFGRPFPGIITALFITVGMIHFIKGTRIMLDDYLHGHANRVAIVVSHIFGWGMIATALFALAKMAFATPVI
jgi:succinate dehydrogenase / fumarate reductase, membrane anchor subunit